MELPHVNTAQGRKMKEFLRSIVSSKKGGYLREEKNPNLTKFDRWDRKGATCKGTIKVYHHFSCLHSATNHLLVIIDLL